MTRKAGVFVLFDIGLSSVVRGMDSTLSNYHLCTIPPRASERTERTTRARLPHCIHAHAHAHAHAKTRNRACICRNKKTDFLCNNQINEVPQGKMLS